MVRKPHEATPKKKKAPSPSSDSELPRSPSYAQAVTGETEEEGDGTSEVMSASERDEDMSEFSTAASQMEEGQGYGDP